MTKLSSLFIAIAMTLPIATASAAGSSDGRSVSSAPSYSASLSPQQRGAMAAQFVRKWGAYVEGVYGLDVGTWAQRMVPQFSRGDATNLQRALARTTYEGAMAEFKGTAVGSKLSDDQAITLLAKASSGSVTPNLLGDTTNDLVYTPITPCRLADTRAMAAGPIAANSSRDFGAWGYASYSFWGGSSTNCGMLSEHPTAVVVNVTAVFPTIPGYATAYAGNIAEVDRPVVSTVNYKAGDIMNNLAVVNINPGSSPDFRIYTYAQSHFTVDIVGFYDNPHATALDCTTVETFTSVPAGGNAFNTSSCPAGYSVSGGGGYWLFSANYGPLYPFTSGSQDYTVRGYNTTGAAQDLYTRARCCRVPGR
jgi:hypothetical protein